MFKYISNVNKFSHEIVRLYSPEFEIAVDCTLGNGYDADFLSEKFNIVYAFDIQKEAVEKYSQKNILNVRAICDSHHRIDEHVQGKVDCIMYNLGYMPGTDKKITTLPETTIESIEKGLLLLKTGGIMCIAIYSGHEEGKLEKEKLLEYSKKLSKKKYAVMLHSFYNRSSEAPSLMVIEKSRK